MNFDRLKDGLVERRALLIAPFAFAGLVAVSSRGSRSEKPASPDGQVSIADFDAAGQRLHTERVAKIHKTDAEWRRQLTPSQYWVTRRKSTDDAYSGTYYQLHANGVFHCICCGLAVFSSAAKFDSGTGWPSFFQAIAEENIYTLKDVSMFIERVEVLCRRCDAHLGHVFTDGPPPTGLRYCINESALHFVEVSSDRRNS